MYTLPPFLNIHVVKLAVVFAGVVQIMLADLLKVAASVICAFVAFFAIWLTPFSSVVSLGNCNKYIYPLLI